MSRLAVFLLAVSVAAAEPPSPTTHQVKLDGQTFTLPVGFTIERVAGPPLVDRPISASFDDRGRLYVTDSSGSNEKPAEQLKHPNHRIIRLEDTKGTGVFDKATVFADKMMFPEGILWYRGSVYVGAPPHIWKLTDTDDDGVADKREVWFDGKTVTGCANDLHGPYLGPDGWIYWCKGAFAKQEYTLANGKKFTTRASHIFRARPDGTGIEPVMTGGMDNPVGLAFLPNGERFFTCTFLQHPAAGKRDGIIHAIYGGIWGKDHDVIYDPDHKWTSPNTMPVMTHLGPAAPCGLCCYQSDAFGKEYTSNLFACQFNLRKVSRHVLKPSGSTYTTEDSDFVVSDSQDFHPTDVVEDADGSLLVVNTGGWYKLCCPSSQLVKADVLGAIYRVRKTDKDYERKWLPAGLKVDTVRQALRLMETAASTTQPTVRDRIRELCQKPVADRDLVLEQMTNGLAKVLYTPRESRSGPTDDQVRVARTAVWMLSQTEGEAARDAVRQAIRGTNPEAFAPAPDSVLIAAIHAAGVWRDRQATPAVIPHLKNAAAAVRRAAAEALGRIGDDRATEPILKALADEKNDRVLDHALTYALIELDNREYLKNKLDADSPRVRRACLAALDQLGEKLDPKVVLEAMSSKDAALKETAVWIVGRHPEWGDKLVGKFQQELSDPKADDPVPQLARLAKAPAIQQLLAEVVGSDDAPVPSRIVALRAMSQSGLKSPPASWYEALASSLDPHSVRSREECAELNRAALATFRTLPEPKPFPKSLVSSLERLRREGVARDVDIGALAVLPPGQMLWAGEIDAVLYCVEASSLPSLRTVGAEALARCKLTEHELDRLIQALPKVSPLELDRILAAFAQTKDDAIGLKLVATLNNPALRASLRANQVQDRIKHFGPAVQKEAEKLYAALNAEYEQQRAKLDEVAKSLKPGDIRRGQAVFNSTKTSCIACHTIGYVGGKIGPDLTRIGSIRQERDLLESILFPSASFVRSYEPLTVRTKDGKVYNGIPKKDAPDEIILILAADKEQRIAREDVDEVQPGKVSIMPAGLDKQLSEQELADLIAFLKACK